MSLIHLLLSSGSCTSRAFFLLLCRNHVYYHFMFPKINKKGGWNKSEGFGNLSKINKRGGDNYSVLESMSTEGFKH